MSTMYRFDWSQIISKSLIERLSASVNEPLGDSDEIRDLLSRVFEGVGGVPIAESDWNIDHRERVGNQLLGEALRATLKHQFGYRRPKPGVITHNVDGVVVATGVQSIDVNRVSREQLEALPVIGLVLAGRIEEERRRNGYFNSMFDLLSRVRGLGDTAGEQLAGVIDFTDHGLTLEPAVGRSLEDDFETLLSLIGYKSGRNRLVSALEEVVLYVATHPHPYTRLKRKRDDLEPVNKAYQGETMARKSQVGILTDRAYYGKLISLLENARESISVCMFYIALPKPDHPTHRLLEVLVRKVAAGCRVQVLVDQDGKEDPYRSRLINSKAATYLLSHGVEVKGDSTERLLHSKFVVVDHETVVIGSHNWTAGSFFHYADVSVIISGTQSCQMWRNRFDSLWSIGEMFRPLNSTTK